MEPTATNSNQGATPAAASTTPAAKSGVSTVGIVMGLVFGSLAVAGIYYGTKEYFIYSIIQSKNKAKRPSDFFDNVAGVEMLLRKCTAMELHKVNQLFNSPDYLEGKPESQWAPATKQLADYVSKQIFAKRSKEVAKVAPVLSATVSVSNGNFNYDIISNGRSIQKGQQNITTIANGESKFSGWGDFTAYTVKKDGYIELVLKDNSGKVLARSGSVKI